MKSIFCSLVLTLSALATQAQAPPTAPTPVEAAQSARPRPEPEHNLHFDLTIISLPSADALPIIEAMSEDAQMDKAYGELLKLVGQRKAEFVSRVNLITTSGQRAVTEDVEELRYPVTFEPAWHTSSPGNEAKLPAKPEADGKAKPETAPAPEEPKPGPAPKLPLETIAAMATAFETRTVGTTLEVDATLNAQTMRLQTSIAVQHAVFAGMARHSVVADGITSVVEQPRVLVSKSQSQFTLTSGRRVLLGSFRAPAKDGWMELLLLRATARPLK